MPDKSINEIFIKNLNRYLDSANMSYSELAYNLNISKSTISMWVAKRSMPRMEVLDKIADLFNISSADLITDNDITKDHKIEPFTIAAHFDGDEYTEEEMAEIRKFAEFVKSQRK